MGLRILVHRFHLGDVEDPEIYAAGPILEFEKSEKGRWLLENSYEQLAYNIYPDYETYGYKVTIHAWLKGKHLTYYKLKWG